MKKKIWLLVSTFLLWTLVFLLQKPCFMLVYAGGLHNVLAVMWHGLPLDLSMAGYLTVVPALVLVAGSLPFMHGPRTAKWLTGIVGVWTAFASLVVALAFVANLALYGYWGFPLDSTPIFFIKSSPSAALASVEWWQALAGLAATAAVAAVVSLLFHLLWRKWGSDVFLRKAGRWQWLPLLLLTALLFLPIRGGVTVSTMNTGKAYFSQDQRLNHAAVNPLFSFMESTAHQEDFARMYRFMDDREAHRLAAQVLPKVYHAYDKRHKPFVPRPAQIINDSLRVGGYGSPESFGPDIYIIILESFSDTLTRQPGVTPNLNRLKREGVYFSHFYANGFRTDRGLVSILLGYPAPGAVSLMKYPRKTSRIHAIANGLATSGYDTHFSYYYGGDADFTNMRSFLISQGFDNITEDTSFPVGDRLSKWGVPDHLLFKRVEDNLAKAHPRKPTFTVIQTSSSHEPFDVPYHRLNDKTLNAFAYTDSCVGGFVNYLKATPRWNRSLVIIVPDHLGAWPSEVDNFASWRFHIPMVWTGGAIRRPMVVGTYGSQQDIAATLYGELGIPTDHMPFSKDMLDPSAPHYAWFMMNDGFGVKTDKNEVIYDNKQRRTVVGIGKEKGLWLKYGQALLQVLFDDIAEK